MDDDEDGSAVEEGDGEGRVWRWVYDIDHRISGLGFPSVWIVESRVFKAEARMTRAEGWGREVEV